MQASSHPETLPQQPLTARRVAPHLAAALLAALGVCSALPPASRAAPAGQNSTTRPSFTGGQGTTGSPQRPATQPVVVVVTPPASPAAGATAPGMPSRNTAQAPPAFPPPPANPGSLPAVDASALESAKTQATAARADVTKAQSAVNEVTRKLKEEFDARPEVVEADKALAGAKSAYDAAVEPVMEALVKREDYRAALSATVAAATRVAEVRADRDATAADRLSAAQSALKARDAVTQLQNQAIDADPKARAAKAAYASAADAAARLHQGFEDGLKQNPDVQAAKDTLTAAKAKSTETDQAVAAAQKNLAAQRAARAAAVAEQQRLARQAPPATPAAPAAARR